VLAASEALRNVHVAWAWVVVGTNAVAGLWALAAHRWERFRRRELWWVTGVAHVAVFVQVILGVWLVQGRDTAPVKFHMFYGFVAAFSVAIIYSYRSQLRPHLHLLYGAGSLFVMGLALRAIYLDPNTLRR
jgi:hypothetical protein